MERPAREVLEAHLQLGERGLLDDDLSENYADDILILSARGELRGHDGVRVCAAFLYDAAEGTTYRYNLVTVGGRMAMLEWGAEGADTRIVDGVDSYLIEDGRIRAQTIHYRVESRRLSMTSAATADAERSGTQ